MSTNISGDVFPEFLISRNYDYAMKALPAIFFLGIILLVGCVGNALVCYVYLFEIRRTNAFANFIMALGILDLANCITNVPFDIFHLSHRFTIGAYNLCYVKSVTNNLISLMSAIILLPMTVDRYRRVCRPLHRQMSAYGAKLSIGICCVASCVLSVPCVFVYGPRTIPMNQGRVNASLCTISEKAGKLLPLVFNGVVLVIFMAIFVTVVIVYSLIWYQLSKQARFRSASISGSCHSAFEKDHKQSETAMELKRKRKSSESDVSMTSRSRCPVRQRTVVMFLISLVFVISFLPHFGIMIAGIFSNLFDNLPAAQIALNNILVRCYFINSASNPIIYGICGLNFRRAVKRSFSRRLSKSNSSRDSSEPKRTQCSPPQSLSGAGPST